ncbi:CD1375 family protein [Enterococcus faecalis]|nr:CD1375 family protein [Enterococcus faecalis]
MAMIYATLIIKGKRTIESVPAAIRKQVVDILTDLEVPELTK